MAFYLRYRVRGEESNLSLDLPYHPNCAGLEPANGRGVPPEILSDLSSPPTLSVSPTMQTIKKTAAYVRANALVFFGVLFAVVVLGTLAHAADSFTSAATFWASGPVGAGFPKQGVYLTSSGGAGYFINNKGVNTGGFVWTQTTGTGFGTQLMLLDASGALHVTQLVGVAQTAHGFFVAPTVCPAGQAAQGIDVSGNVVACIAVPGEEEELLAANRFVRVSQRSRTRELQALIDRVDVLEKEVEQLHERERGQALLMQLMH